MDTNKDHLELQIPNIALNPQKFTTFKKICMSSCCWRCQTLVSENEIETHYIWLILHELTAQGFRFGEKISYTTTIFGLVCRFISPYGEKDIIFITLLLMPSIKYTNVNYDSPLVFFFRVNSCSPHSSQPVFASGLLYQRMFCLFSAWCWRVCKSAKDQSGFSR